MFHKLETKSTIVIIFILLTFICLSQCKGGRGGGGGGRGGSRGSSSGGSRGWGSSSSKGSGKGWFSSLFGSSRKTGSSSHNYGSNSHNYGSTSSRNTGSSSGSSSHTYNVHRPGISYSHPNQKLPGGVKPPPGVQQPHGPPPAYSRTNTYSNSNPREPPPVYSVNPDPGHQSLGGYRPSRPSSLGNSYHRTYYVSGYSTYGNQALIPPPPPPPGFINSRNSGGAAPSYTYQIDNYLSRGSNNQLTAGLVLWELSKHRSHYRVLHPMKSFLKAIPELPVNEEIVPGDTYIILPTDLKCHLTSSYMKSLDIFGYCDTHSTNMEFRIVLPSNKTKIIPCLSLEGTCIASAETFSEADMTPVDFKIFNETAVYGAPLCNTTVVNGSLEIAFEQYRNGTSPCVYPPYKWTGEKWTTFEAEIQKEKIKENFDSVYNVTKVEDKTLRALAHSMSFGKFFDLFYNSTK